MRDIITVFLILLLNIVLLSTYNGISTLSSTHLIDTSYPTKQILDNNKNYKHSSSDNIVLKLVERQDKMLHYLIVASLMLAGLFTTYFLYNAKNFRDDIKDYKKEVNIQVEKEILRLQDTVTTNIKENVNDKIINEVNEQLEMKISGKIEEVVRKDIERIFESEYNEIILRYVNSKIEEVIMKTPESRDIIATRLRRMNKDISNLLEDTMGTDKVNELYEIIESIIIDWVTINELYSINNDKKHLQLLSALGKIKDSKFIEVREKLEKLKVEYDTNIQIEPIISEAINHINISRKQ